jgi:hypothetical protein
MMMAAVNVGAITERSRPQGVVRRAVVGASSSGTIVAGGGVNGLPLGVAKMRIVPQKEDRMDSDVEGSKGAMVYTSSALMESALAHQPGHQARKWCD